MWSFGLEETGSVVSNAGNAAPARATPATELQCWQIKRKDGSRVAAEGELLVWGNVEGCWGLSAGTWAGNDSLCHCRLNLSGPFPVQPTVFGPTYRFRPNGRNGHFWAQEVFMMLTDFSSQLTRPRNTTDRKSRFVRQLSDQKIFSG